MKLIYQRKRSISLVHGLFKGAYYNTRMIKLCAVYSRVQTKLGCKVIKEIQYVFVVVFIIKRLAVFSAFTVSHTYPHTYNTILAERETIFSAGTLVPSGTYNNFFVREKKKDFDDKKKIVEDLCPHLALVNSLAILWHSSCIRELDVRASLWRLVSSPYKRSFSCT